LGSKRALLRAGSETIVRVTGMARSNCADVPRLDIQAVTFDEVINDDPALRRSHLTVLEWRRLRASEHSNSTSCVGLRRWPRMASKRRKKKPPGASPPQGDPPVVRISKYKVTDEPIQDASIRALPNKERAHVIDLVEELRDLLYSNPQEAIPRLEQAIREHPTVAPFDNFLLAACKKSGQFSRVNSLVVEQYTKRPDYLFARLNYAEFLMDQGRFDEVPGVFGGGCFDLAMLYPSRKVFHLSEVTSFMGSVGAYLCHIGNPDSANTCLDVLEQLAPDSPHADRLRALLDGGIGSNLLRLLRSWR
jgi:hypothetical protein